MIIAGELACAALGFAEEADTMTSIEGAITSTFEPEGCKEGRLTKAGDQLKMHYTGTIADTSEAGEKGKQFDSSLDGGRDPFDFQLGMGQVIKGWDQGLMDMCVGEKRTLIVPPALGYGANGAGNDIPGGATLKFTVECIGIEEGKEAENLFATIDADKDDKLTAEEVGAWFKKEQGGDMPEGLMDQEDKDKNGHISWDEFSGPKGPARDEL